MYKFCILLVVLINIHLDDFAQRKQPYHPESNASKEINNAILEAKKTHKFVLLQGGGNWCEWCLEFYHFCKEDKTIDSIINKNFVWYHLNYSKENKNESIFRMYGYPQRFGFPVFIILNEEGKRIHTQNSEYLEDGKSSYDRKKIISFLEVWSPDALDPKKY